MTDFQLIPCSDKNRVAQSPILKGTQNGTGMLMLLQLASSIDLNMWYFILSCLSFLICEIKPPTSHGGYRDYMIIDWKCLVDVCCKC